MAVNARCLTLSVVVMPTTQGNAVRTEFVWDPTEPVATRPLVLRAKNWGLNLFYSHDGNLGGLLPRTAERHRRAL